jgi:hypothetical protein
MRRVFVGFLALAACACAPAPARVPAAEAGELLARFAAGTAAPRLDVCTPEGRSVLRGAVRAYGAELHSNGVMWPALPGLAGQETLVSSVDASVLVAFAAGFVEASDLQGPARRLAQQLTWGQWPEIRRMREAASVACDDAAELQHAAARVVVEMARLESMGEADSAREAERLESQRARVERARRQMQQIAAFVEAEVEAAREQRT